MNPKNVNLRMKLVIERKNLSLTSNGHATSLKVIQQVKRTSRNFLPIMKI